MSAFVNYISARPYLSHGLLGLLYAAILVPFVHPVAVFALVSVLFYGREIGQLNHDLLHAGASEWTAWWKAHALNLSLDEVTQVLAPMISSGAVAVAAHILSGLALPAHFV